MRNCFYDTYMFWIRVTLNIAFVNRDKQQANIRERQVCFKIQTNKIKKKKNKGREEEEGSGCAFVESGVNRRGLEIKKIQRFGMDLVELER